MIQEEDKMRKHSKILVMALALLFVGTLSFTQDVGVEKITVPFSNPGKPGKVQVSSQRGSITITGYNGQEVIVEAALREKKLGEEEADVEERVEEQLQEMLEVEREGKARKQRDTSGMKKLQLPGSLRLSIEEEGNHMEIRTQLMRQAVDLVIQVPYATSLELRTMMGGVVVVDNVKGEIEVNNMNGPITLTAISGTVMASAMNGDVEVTFAEINPDKPMSFSTMSGDIDVTLPASTKANLKMKTNYGDIFSDFEIKVDTTPQKVKEEPEKEGERYRIAFDRYYIGAINGGGPEYLLKTFHGDILIRKAK